MSRILNCFMNLKMIQILVQKNEHWSLRRNVNKNTTVGPHAIYDFLN